MDEIIQRLDRITRLLEQNQATEILTFKEACEYTSLSESYMYKLTHQRKIPHYSPNNKKLIFKRSELDQWLLRNKRSTMEELDTLAGNHLLTNKTESQ